MDRTQDNLLTEVNQKEKDKYHMISLIHGNRLTGIENTFVVAEEGDGGYRRAGLEVWD